MAEINPGKFLKLVKFSHTIFALPFALTGFFMASKVTNQIDWKILIWVLVCMVTARNAAMGFNRFLDRKIDAKNPRTKTREIPAGIIKPTVALWFVIINCLLFIGSTWFINTLCFFLSPVALIVILGYSFTKKYTSLCHFVLGLGLSLAPIGAYIAVTGSFAVIPVILSIAVLMWVSGFDIIYALQDEGFDKEEKLRSIPVLMGGKNAMLLSEFIHFLSAAAIVLCAVLLNGSYLFWVGSLCFISLLLYQHIVVRAYGLSKINLAFFTLNGFASLIFGIFAIADLILF